MLQDLDSIEIFNDIYHTISIISFRFITYQLLYVIIPKNYYSSCVSVTTSHIFLLLCQFHIKDDYYKHFEL